MTLDRNSILEKNDLTTRKVEVPEWGGHVYLKEMTGTERDKFEAESFVKVDGQITFKAENQRARLLVLCLCDESGNRTFTDDDEVILGRKSAAILERLFKVASQLNGLAPAAIEDAIKN